MTIDSKLSISQKLQQRASIAWQQLLSSPLLAPKSMTIDATVLLFDNCVCNVETGRTQTISELNAAELASAVAELLPQSEHPLSVRLLLPPQDFLTTEVHLPAISGEALRSAIALQSAVLIPSYEAELSFSIGSKLSESDRRQVVWVNTAKIDHYYSEFKERGIFLADVAPRAAAQASNAQAQTLLDEDSTTITLVSSVNGLISSWQQIEKADLEEPHFKAQWEQALLQAGEQNILTCRSAEDYHSLLSSDYQHPYSFVPRAAKQVANEKVKGKRTIVAAAASIVLVLLAMSPFLFQTIQKSRLQSQLAQARVQSAEARENQAIVRDFESEWGALTEFPVQDISVMLLALQQELSPSVLSSLEVDEGVVEIEGESPDPQSILQRLEQNPAFAGVDFSRATNNNRYYIEMRLSTVDFDSYRQWYFPDERR
ncbi:MAG: hypothetical protein R3332_08860 [Pseudohongiellaceae bacterium]|nr:hypothetical protein [Pseudohongiellaceae bacterium]